MALRAAPFSVPPARRWPLLLRLAVSAALVGLGLAARAALDPVIGPVAPFSIFLIGVALAAYLAGTGPAIGAVVLFALGADYWYLGDRGRLDFSSLTLAAQGVFVVVSAVFIAMVHVLRRTQHQLAVRADELEQQRQWFHVTFSSIGDGVITTDTQARITFLNPAAEALTGWPASEAKGKPVAAVFNLLHEIDRQPLVSPVVTAIAEGKVITFAHPAALIARDGREYAIEDSAAPIRAPDGSILGAVMVFHDVTDRRRQAGALRAAESRKAAILDASLDAIVTMDHRGHVADFNRAAVRIFGYEMSYALGKTMAELIIPERYREAHQRGLERLLATGEAHVLDKRLELSAVHANGREFPVELSISQIAGASPPMFTGTLRDITVRKQAEQALRESEERQRATFEQAAVGIAVAELDGRLVEMNPKITELFGYSVAELKGRTFIDLTHPDDVARTRHEVERLLRGEIGQYAIEKRYVRGDHTVVWSKTSVALLKDADGTPRKMIGVLEDITGRKTAEEALRKSEADLRASEARLRVSLEASALGTWDFDPSTELMSLDRRCQELFGLPGRETIDLPTFEHLAHPEDRSKRMKCLRAALDHAKAYDIEYRTASEPVRWLRAAGRVVSNTTGQPSHLVTAVADITDLVKARESMAERRRELEDLVKARTASLQEAIGQMEEFSYSVSHDLRAPLRAIQGYAEAVAEDYADKLDATGRGYLERIANAAFRMDRLTQDVLTYSKIGREAMKVETISLNEVVDETLEQYVQRTTPTQVTVARPLLDVQGHEALLVQAISNLITNAVKFVRPGEVPQIHIRTESTARGVRLWVEDQGIGIPPENQQRIWGLFERVHAGPAYDGTGVGLAVVRKAVERMGGTVGVVSDGKTGSKFWIELPHRHLPAARDLP